MTKRAPRPDARGAGAAPGAAETALTRSAPASSLERARRAAAVADDKRAENIVILDLRGLTLVTDYFVICTSTNRVQSHAIVEALDDTLARGPRRARGGDDQATWILVDYGDVVVHVFSSEARTFYRLERLWADAAAVAR